MQSQGDKAAAAALSQVGVPYVWGGETPGKGFDCSGLTQWAWARAGKTIPRTTITQWPAMRPVLRSQLQPGDCLYYAENDGGPGPGHVTMYLGGGRIVQAAHTGTRIATGAVWFGAGYLGARRPWGVARSPVAGQVGAQAQGSRQTKCTGLNALNPFCQLGLEFETVGRWLEVGAGGLGLIVGVAIMVAGAFGTDKGAGQKAAGIATTIAKRTPAGVAVGSALEARGERKRQVAADTRELGRARAVRERGEKGTRYRISSTADARKAQQQAADEVGERRARSTERKGEPTIEGVG